MLSYGLEVAVIRFVGTLIIGAAFVHGGADRSKAAELLSERQMIECATRFADMLRAWPVVEHSKTGVDLAWPAMLIQEQTVPGDIGPMIEALVRAVQVRLGAKVQFVRRDSEDPGWLPLSQRFDYETRLVVRPLYQKKRSQGSVELVLQLFEPADSSAAFAVNYVFEPAGRFVGQPARPESRRARQAEEADDAKREAAEPQTPSAQRADDRRPADDERQGREAIRRAQAEQRAEADKRERERREAERDLNDRLAKHHQEMEKKAKRVITLDRGHLYFRDSKTASRVAVLSERVRPLSDGRLQVEISLVCRRKDQDVEIRTSFYNDRRERVGRTRKIEYKLEEGRPQTVVVRSQEEAVRFVMEIEKD